MKRFLGFVLAAALALTPASAQSPQVRAVLLGVGVPAAGAAFVGPVDAIASPLGCWSLRACSSALRGQKVANVCNSTGGVDVGCADMLSSASTGDLVSATVSGITCPGANCTVKTLYFQTGSLTCTGACDLTQATVANRPTLTTSCGSFSKAFCMAWAGSTTQLVAATGTSGALSNPLTISAVAEKTGGGETGIFATNSGTAFEMAFESFANGVFVFNNGAVHGTATQADNAWHSFQGVMPSGASSQFMNVDGVSGSLFNSGAGGISSGSTLAAGVDSFNQHMIGNSSEYLLYPIAFTSGNSITMCHNQFAYWGTSVSC